MNAEVIKTFISGCFEIQPEIKNDDRGQFIKVFHKDFYIRNHLEYEFSEEYYSISHKGVLRGLHFQIPPREHVKLVYCIEGCVLDAIVDLRKNSPSYGRIATFELSKEKANILYISPGLAHGFYVLSEQAIVVYKVSTVYSPKHDTGILWNSVGIPWPDKRPIISERDSQFIKFEDFKSPF